MYGNYISYTCSNKLHVAKSKLGIAVFNLELARARKSFHLVCKTHKKKIRTNTANIEMIALTIYRESTFVIFIFATITVAHKVL